MKIRRGEEVKAVEKAWLDVAVFRCPRCGRIYAEAAWYAVEIGADIECGSCGAEFNPTSTLLDRVMLEFSIEGGRVIGVRLAEEDQSSNLRTSSPQSRRPLHDQP